MKIITCCSYYGTGSSAITDFFSEFSNVQSLGDYEFRFLHDPDGVRDLEYNLLDNFNRHNSGHALKRYKRLVDYYCKHFLAKRYAKYFGDNWRRISYEFIDNLTDFSFKGSWQYDYYDRGRIYEFFHKLPDRLLRLTFWKNKPDKSFNTLKKEITYCSHPDRDNFFGYVKKYTKALFDSVAIDGKEYLMVDQLFPSTNINHFLDYVDDSFVFVVDRDPRDVFISYKYLYPNSIVPSDVYTFCKWYRYCRSTRNIEEWDKNRIIFVQFEDMIYKYEETSKMISDFIGISEHCHALPFSRFDPLKSIKNTRLWDGNNKYKEEVAVIEELLSDYLYTYEGDLK